jgi:hemolysin activation/secretion protein
VIAAALLSANTLAHVIVPPDQLRRPAEVPLPLPPERTPSAPEIKVPATAPPPPATSLSLGSRFQAREFRFEGNTVFSNADLQAIAAPFVGRELGTLDLDELRVRITRHYIDQGYINSGAVIPDQDVTDGIVAFRIVEGKLAEIRIGGAHRFNDRYLTDRIGRGAADVLNVNRLQEHMQVLLQDPLIERISAELAPGANPGEAVLRADVKSAPLFVAGITVANERSPAVGDTQAEGTFTLRNLFGRGDVITLRPAHTEGLRDFSFGVSLPVSTRGTNLSFRAQRTRSRIVEAPLDQLDISARAESIELGISHPLISAPRRSVNLSAAVTRRASDSFFLGLPSPFIPGASNGRTAAAVARFGIDGVDRSAERVLAGRLQLSQGFDAFGAAVAGPGIADSRFKTWLLQGQWVERVGGEGSHFVVRGELQRANDMLLGPEKYSVGGAESVRGYRKDVLVRDSGWLASAEYRHLLTRIPWFGSEAAPGEGALHLAVFADTAGARDHDGSTRSRQLSSVGTGLRWEPAAGFEIQAYYGKALNNIATPTRTLQDHGIHLRLALTRAF